MIQSYIVGYWVILGLDATVVIEASGLKKYCRGPFAIKGAFPLGLPRSSH